MRKVNSEKIKSVAVLVTAAIVAWVFADHFMWSPTNSLKERFFWRLESQHMKDRIGHGSFVEFNRFVPEPKPKVYSLIKRVACAEGESLEYKPGQREFYCNGQYLGRAKERTRMGTPLKPFEYVGQVPKGKMFVMGDHVDSYDSRYWGFLDKSEVKSRAVGLF